MFADTDSRDYVEQRCRDFAATVWNEALDRAVEQIHKADNYRDAAVRINKLKIKPPMPV